jgi:peptidoglycan hydrolase-like protein with peptidoglycan-binding domain
VGAVVGGVGGAYAGHEMAKGGPDEKVASSSPSASRYDPTLVRNVQQALNGKGYNAGPVDGQWGPATEDALTRFQQAAGVAQTGAPDRSTLTALGVAK